MGTYEVEVTAHSYNNPSGRCDECRSSPDSDPRCCDETSDRPLEQQCPFIRCDTTVKFCFRSLGENETSCPPDERGTTTSINTNYATFGTLFFGIANPQIHSSILAWEVSVVLLASCGKLFLFSYRESSYSTSF